MKGLLKRISSAALLALLLPFSGVAQVTAAFPSRVASDQDTLLAANKAQSNLVQPLTSSATNFQLISASSFKAPGVVTIDNEIIWFCSVSGNLLYVCPGGRGFDNTFPSFHAAGSQVSGLMTAYHHNRLAAEVKAIETALGTGMTSVMPASRQFNFSELLGKATAQQLAIFDANLGFTAPGSVTLRASTATIPSLVIPPGTAPTSPTTGALWNVGGTLSYFDGTVTHPLVALNVSGQAVIGSSTVDPAGKLTLGTATYTSYAFSGTCNTAAASPYTVISTGGANNFASLSPGMPIKINNVTYVVGTVTDATHVNLTSSPGTQTGVAWGVAGVTTSPDIAAATSLRVSGGNMYLTGGGLMVGTMAAINSGGQFGWVQPYGVGFHLGDANVPWGTLYANAINWSDGTNWGSSPGNSLGGLDSNGKLTVFNQKAATGSSNVTIQAGAGQSTNDLFNIKANGGGNLFSVGSGGIATINGGLGLTGVFAWAGSSAMQAPSDGKIELSNYSGTNFTALQLGGTTSAFPSIKRNGTALNFRLADDSADAPITSGAATVGGTLTVNSGYAVINTVAALTSGLIVTDNTNYTLTAGYAAAGVGRFGGAGGNALALYANGAESMRLISGGNVGIGTTTPGCLLGINRASGSYGESNAHAEFSYAGNGSQAKMFLDSGLSFNLKTYTTQGGNGHIVFLPAGNVGIGTTAPASPLSVQAGINLPLFQLNSSTYPTTYGMRVGSFDSGNSGVLYQFQIQQFTGNTWNNVIQFGNGSNAANPALTISPGATPTAAYNGIQFGSDANLYRSAAGTVKTDGTLNAVAHTVNNAAAVNNARALAFAAYVGADATLHDLNVLIGAFPSATASQRYSYIQTQDYTGYRPLALQPDGGSVGIGTIAPAYTLDVQNVGPQLAVRSKTDGGGRAIAFVGGSTSYNFLVGNQYNIGNAFEITPSTAAGGTTFSTPAVTVLSSGYVGIGKTNPGVPLDVVGTVQASVNFYSKQFNGDTGTTFQNGTSGDLNITNAIAGNIRFLTGGTAGANERMRIDGTGNVGIGTTNPQTLLHIVGATPEFRTAGNAANQNLLHTFYDNNATVMGKLLYAGGNSVGSRYFGFINQAADYLGFFNAADVPVEFWTNNAERMRINTGGNVGIGTPSPAGKLTSYHATNVAPSITSGSFAPFIVNDAGVEIAFGADSNSPFNAWMQARITGDTAKSLVINPLGGNVGIGTTNPAVKLHVTQAAVASPFVAGTGSTVGGFALTDATNLFGLYTGLLTSGNAFVQAGRTDSATYYHLMLQPNGGSVGISANNLLGRLTIGSPGGSDASLGAELATGTWTSAGWTGSAVPFTHTPGNTSALSLTIPSLAANSYYQVFVQTSSRTAGTIATTLGGVVIDPGTYYLTGSPGWTHGIKAATTGALIITPTTDFDGAVTVSVKLVTPVTGYALAMLDSAGNISATFSQRSNAAKSFFIGGGGQYEVYGYNSMAIGLNALQYNVTGINNTAIGALTLQNNLSGDANTAIGMNTLVANVNGGANTGIGSYVLTSNTSGGNNTAIGVQALQGNNTGNSNTGIGVYALQANTTGAMNAAIGMGSLFANTTASSNTAVGFYAASAVQTSAANTAIGDHAMYQGTSYQNVSIGAFSLGATTSGNNNVAVGYVAGGWNTGNYNTTGSNNTWLGAGTQPAGSSGGTQYNYQTVIGAGATAACSNCVVLGRSSDAVVAPGAVSTPVSSSASCTAGQLAFDANYEYRCVAANTWKRAALAVW